MKIKTLLISVLLLLTLTACGAPTADQIKLSLKPGIDTVEINTAYEDAGIKATVYGLPVKVSIIENTVDMSKIGTYQITYQVDYRGVIKTMTRYVFVVDETAPVGLINPGIDTIYLGTTWVDTNVEVSDNSNDEISIITTGTVDSNTLGNYLITYTLEDTSGNVSTYYRWVSVIENPNQ